ncbi:hypothetical protein BTTAP_210001 [Brochothrix thermosphacta]|uniref:Uncharacterized protein n=1 Tax=Brochothrix thermosphacta TaxID=2756 RepID=A0A2X0R7H2_BROTH|nr:hypothetical protein BTH160X_270001 [Brochothrix thermosphacta]SPN75689.1 hypothetical protein BTEBP_290017 [Brochothrix thermosphacta]SPP28899.1 hypothetical protein BTTAP_210001 [Brochothrix thermosphacta]SPP30150.1 hypothetical protein BTBSAS_70001 [Brochothrix thermosphacta]
MQLSCALILYNAVLAQLVERIHGKDEVAGSIPANGFYYTYKRITIIR